YPRLLSFRTSHAMRVGEGKEQSWSSPTMSIGWPIPSVTEEGLFQYFLIFNGRMHSIVLVYLFDLIFRFSARFSFTFFGNLGSMTIDLQVTRNGNFRVKCQLTF